MLRNNTNKRFDIPKIAFFVSVLFIGFFIYLINIKYPIYLDDWVYSFTYQGDTIENFWGIIYGQYLHYHQWGGRSVVHTIAQCLLWAGESWGDIFNTAAYMAFVLLVYAIANKYNKANAVLFLIINIMIWFFLPDFSQDILWITGSANYLWGGLLVVAFMYFYVSYFLSYDQKKQEGSILKNVLFLLFGIFAGWTNENMAVALIFFLIVLIVVLKIRKIPVPKWMWFGLVGAIIGCVVMLLAPGNYIRNKQELYNNHKMHEIELSFYFYRFVTVIKLASVYIITPVLIYISLLALYLWNGKNTDKKKKRDVLTLSLLFFGASGVALCAMAGSPVFPERAWYGIVILLVIAIAILVANFDLSNKIVKTVYYVLFAAIFSMYAISCRITYVDLSNFSQVMQARVLLAKEAKKQAKDEDIISYGIFYQNESELAVLKLPDWMEDDSWSKKFARYHGVNSFKVRDNIDNNNE